MAWTNSDGLIVKFGTEEATVGTAGQYRTNGPLRMVELTCTLTGLGTAAAVQDQHCVIPSGSRIDKVEVVAETAATSGGSAALNVGLIRLDRSTELDYDGFVAAMPKTAIDAAGEYNTLTPGSTSAGALIGTTLAYAGVLTADYDTAAFTAGKVKVRVFYYVP